MADHGDHAVNVPGAMFVRVGGLVGVVLEALFIEVEARSDVDSIEMIGPSFPTVLVHVVDVRFQTVIVRGKVMRDKTAPGYPEGAAQMVRLLAKDAF